MPNCGSRNPTGSRAVADGLARGGGRLRKSIGDDLIVEGRAGDVAGGGMVATHLDHRIAMSFLCLGLASRRADGDRRFAHDRDQLSRSFGRSWNSWGRSSMIIAVDGPAACGKGTLARALAAHFGLPHLDTGLLYRATARALMGDGRRSCRQRPRFRRGAGLALADLDEIALRDREMAEAASIVARASRLACRASALFERQTRLRAQRRRRRPRRPRHRHRDLSRRVPKIIRHRQPRGPRERAVLLELKSQGEKADYAAVLADILTRDERDKGRAAAPLMAAKDAIVLDTTALDVEAAFQAALAIVMGRAGKQAS